MIKMGFLQPFLITALLAMTLPLGAESQVRVFIKDLEPGPGVSKQDCARVRDSITLSIFERYGTTCKVVSDDDIRIMYQQAEKMLVAACDAEACIIEIANSIQAEEIIYGILSSSMGKMTLSIQNLKRNASTKDFFKKSMVQEEFYSSQLEWYAREAGKKLMDPSYYIDPSKAPTEMKVELKLKDVKLPEVRTGDIAVFEFQTDDSTIARIIDYAKVSIKEGDEFYSSKSYYSAIRKYEDVVTSIETKLPPSKQEKLAKFKAGVIERAIATHQARLKASVERADEKTKAEDFDEALADYESIGEEVKSVSKKYGNRFGELRRALNERKDNLYLFRATRSEKLADKLYADYKFPDAFSSYDEGLGFLAKVANTNTQDFSALRAKISQKRRTAWYTGYSYFKNSALSYCDWIDYYNFSDNKAEASDNLDKLRAYISDGLWCDDKTVIKEFNDRATLLGQDSLKPCDRSSGAWSGGGRTKRIGGIDFVFIPAGEFMMGSPEGVGDSDEHPQHKVRLSAFWISKFEVTQAQWTAVMGKNPSYFKGDTNPVEKVSWNGCQDFCRKFNVKYNARVRLPTEAEWEYACRAGTTTTYYWGNNMDDSCVWYSGNADSKTHPVGQKRPMPGDCMT